MTFRGSFVLRRLVAVPLLLTVVGCNLLTPLIFIGDHKRKVAPEFDKLPDSRVAVLVWTDPATLYDYPNAREELGTYLADKLAAELAQRELGTEVVSPKQVEAFVKKDSAAQIDPAKVGAEFKTDYVVYIEVVGLQFRAPEQPQFLQGRIDASIAVYDTRGGRPRGERFALTPVECVYPSGTPVLMNATNALLVREATYHQFAEQIARKFYEHTVDL